MATKTAKTGGSMLKVTLTAGLVGKMDKQRKIVRALGLGKFGSSAVHSDSPTIWGMVNKVSHLVSVQPTTEQPKAKAPAKAKDK